MKSQFYKHLLHFQITKPGQPRFRKPFKRNRNEGDPEGHQNFEGNKKVRFIHYRTIRRILIDFILGRFCSKR